MLISCENNVLWKSFLKPVFRFCLICQGSGFSFSPPGIIVFYARRRYFYWSRYFKMLIMYVELRVFKISSSGVFWIATAHSAWIKKVDIEVDESCIYCFITYWCFFSILFLPQNCPYLVCTIIITLLLLYNYNATRFICLVLTCLAKHWKLKCDSSLTVTSVVDTASNSHFKQSVVMIVQKIPLFLKSWD